MAELQGFTLFYGAKGWQLSVRAVGEDGWSVHQLDREQAAEILSAVGSNPLVIKSLAAPDGKRPRTGKLDFSPRKPARQRVSLDD